MSLTFSECVQMLEDCEAKASGLTEYEEEFIADIYARVDMGWVLTKRQIEILTKTWERVTAEEVW